jgi:ribosome-associated translation inhibitor RaiA
MKVLTKEKFERIESRLKNFPEDTKSARVVLNTAPDDKFEAKVLITAGKFEYFSDEIDYSLESAIIKTVDELLRMMERDKERWEAWEREIRETKMYKEPELSDEE